MLINTFSRIDNDRTPSLSGMDSYEMALNAVRGNRRHLHYGLSNEGSTERVADIDAISGGCLIEGRDWFFIILESGEIGYFDTKSDKYVRICNLNNLQPTQSTCDGQEVGSACEFKFTNCEWIECSHNYWNNCNELHVQFSHKCTYYTLNIDELIDPQRRAKVSCYDLRTFKCTAVPVIKGYPTTGGGAGLPNGVYLFSCRLINNDGHPTNWFDISNEISIGDDKFKPGDLSNQYINLYIEGLDCRYSTMEIAVIKKIGGILDAYVVDTIHYHSKGYSFEYRGETGRERRISIAELTTKKVNYLQGRKLTIDDSRCFYYQIKNEKNLNVQYYADQVQVRLRLYKVSSQKAHLYKGLQPHERYQLGLVYSYCDGTETRVGIIGPGGGLEPRGENNGTGGEVITDGRDQQQGDGGTPEGGGSGGGNGSGGATTLGNYTYNTSGLDDYADYDQLPTDHDVVQNDVRYGNGQNSNNGSDDPIGKIFSDAIDGAADELPDDNAGDDCLTCGSDAWTKTKNTLKNIMTFGLYDTIQSAIQRTKKNKGSKTSAAGSKIKEIVKKLKDAFEKEEFYLPKRVELKVNNPKPKPDGGTMNIDPNGTAIDNIEKTDAIFVQYLDPIWVSSGSLFPYTKDCSGGYLYGDKAGTPVMLLEIPPVPQHFETSTVGARGPLMNLDEYDGWVYFVGLEYANVPIPTLDELGGKPLSKYKTWKAVYTPRDEFNSRVIGSGLLTGTFEGDIQGVRMAIPKNGVNGPERCDRNIGRGGDEYDHEGDVGANKIYSFICPDALLGGILLNATHFIIDGQCSGDGHRLGLYAEHKKDPGFWVRPVDQRGYRGTIALHSYTSSPGSPIAIKAISKVKADSTVHPVGMTIPFCNLSRESTVAIELESGPDETDMSFIADGLIHYGPIYSALSSYGHAIREMKNQYGSPVNARYADIGLYGINGASGASGLVGDSHVNCFNIRRTSYISNRVGDRTFIPSPRKWSGLARFFGYGDPTENPENADERDPKNWANRHPGLKIEEAARAGNGTGSVYYPGVQKTLLYFWSHSRVNTYYRQRGDDEGQVHARNLGTLSLDPMVPVGGDWVHCYLTRYYKEVKRESGLIATVRAGLRWFVILGIPAWFFLHKGGFGIGSIFDLAVVWIRLAVFLLIWGLAMLYIFTVSRINKALGLKAQLKDREGGAMFEEVRQFEDNFMKYNSDYNKGSSLAPSVGMSDPFNVCNCATCSDSYYTGDYKTIGNINNLVYYTPKQRINTEINAFQNVLYGDYGAMQSVASQLQKLFTFNNMLYGICSDGIYRLTYDGDVPYQGLDYLLGNGRALGTPIRIMEGLPEGYKGTVDPNALVVTPRGVLFPDAKDRTWNIFNGATVKELTDGVQNLMYNHMPFCNQGDRCRDQRKKGGVWYCAGYDPYLDRFLITKNEESGWTLSVDGIGFISAHSYVPDFYISTRDTLYSVKNGTIWKHNSKTSRQVMYGKYEPFIVWFSSNNLQPSTRYLVPDQFSFVEIHTEAYKNGIIQDKTFNVGGWNTSYQMTGKFVLDTMYGDHSLHKDMRERKFFETLGNPSRGLWRFNRLKDYIINKQDPIIKETPCSFITDYTDNVSCKPKGGGNVSVLADYYLRHMLVLDEGDSELDLKLIRVATEIRKKER